MTKKGSRLYLIIISLFLFINIIGCTNNGIRYKKEFPKDTEKLLQDIEKINIKLVEMNEIPEGTNYTVKLVNDSQYLIKQNVLFVSLPIITENGYRENTFKIEAAPNRLDIYPGQEIILNAFAPVEVYSNNDTLDNKEVSYKFIGYLNDVKEEQKFTKGGSLR